MPRNSLPSIFCFKMDKNQRGSSKSSNSIQSNNKESKNKNFKNCSNYFTSKILNGKYERIKESEGQEKNIIIRNGQGQEHEQELIDIAAGNSEKRRTSIISTATVTKRSNSLTVKSTYICRKNSTSTDNSSTENNCIETSQNTKYTILPKANSQQQIISNNNKVQFYDHQNIDLTDLTYTRNFEHSQTTKSTNNLSNLGYSGYKEPISHQHQAPIRPPPKPLRKSSSARSSNRTDGSKAHKLRNSSLSSKPIPLLPTIKSKMLTTIWYHSICSIFDLENMVNWNKKLNENEIFMLETDLRFDVENSNVVMSHDKKLNYNDSNLYPKFEDWLEKLENMVRIFNFEGKIGIKYDFKEIEAVEGVVDFYKNLGEKEENKNKINFIKNIPIWLNADIVKNEEKSASQISNIEFIKNVKMFSSIDSDLKIERISIGWNLKYYISNPDKFKPENKAASLIDMNEIFNQLPDQDLLPDPKKLTFAICADLLTAANVGRGSINFVNFFNNLRKSYKNDTLKFSITFWTMKSKVDDLEGFLRHNILSFRDDLEREYLGNIYFPPRFLVTVFRLTFLPS